MGKAGAEGDSRAGVVIRGVCPRCLPGRARSPGKKRLSAEEGNHWLEKLRQNKQQWPGGGLPMLGKKTPQGPCKIGETLKAPPKRKS